MTISPCWLGRRFNGTPAKHLDEERRRLQTTRYVPNPRYVKLEEGNLIRSYLLPLQEMRPDVWIPRDSLGISEDEVKNTYRLGKDISVTNEGATLDCTGDVILE